MDELKNLVIQTLETNGILGQLRAQLRSCVFKVIDNQEQVEKGQSSFHWENPNAKKVVQTAEGVVCAELIREFLEFYRLDYTLQIYMPEVNLNQQQAMSKEELSRRAGLGQASENKPLMVQLLEAFLSGGGAQNARSQAPPAAGARDHSPVQVFEAPSAPVERPVQSASQPLRKEEPVSENRGSPDIFGSRTGQQKKIPDPISANHGSKKSDHERHLEVASQMLEEQSHEERSGYKAEIHKSAGSYQQSSQKSQSPSPVAPPSRSLGGNAQHGIPKEKSNEFADNYGDDFEDDIQEEIPDGNDDTDNLLSGSGNNFGQNPGGPGQQQHRSTIISESAGGITVSQSLGVDPSVDSLALEDYDHIEPVERVNY